MQFKSIATLSLIATVVTGTVYFKEDFSGDWESKWVQSTHDDGYGEYKASAGNFGSNVGLQTSQDAKFYSISAAFDKFSNEDKDLVVQYSVKFEQGIDCGGGYIKLSPSTVDQADYHGETDYNIMFGPDICGATKRTHLIFNYNDDNHLKTSDMRTESDELTHLYTLIVKPDRTYTVNIDQKEIASGNLVDDFAFLPPKEIKDPEVSKPADWVDESQMADPEDEKPEDWDDEEEYIIDPEAEKPEDWDDDDDGEWEAPTIENPEFKGEWEPAMIDNPDYKGPWVHPMIANPDYADDETIGTYPDFGVLGIDIWQVKSGTIFDSIIVTDSLDEANAYADETYLASKDEEKSAFEADKAEKAAEAEAAAAAAAEEEDELSEEDDDVDADEADGHDEL
jgi:calreticulin